MEALVSSIGTPLVIRWTYSGAVFSPSGDCPRTKSRSKKHANSIVRRACKRTHSRSKKHANTVTQVERAKCRIYSTACMEDLESLVGDIRCLKKNLNARPSEHPPVRGGNVKTFRWDHRLQLDKTSS